MLDYFIKFSLYFQWNNQDFWKFLQKFAKTLKKFFKKFYFEINFKIFKFPNFFAIDPF
jgi:hypothetical protein